MTLTYITRYEANGRHVLAYTDDIDCVPPDTRNVQTAEGIADLYTYARAASIARRDLIVEVNTRQQYVLFEHGQEVTS